MWQGKAYEGIKEGTYYPAVSLYTHREQQTEPAAVTVNFGDSPWAFPPPQLPDWPPPRPASEMARPRPVEATAAAAAAQQVKQERQQAGEEQQRADGADRMQVD